MIENNKGALPTIHHKDLLEPIAKKAKIPMICLSPYSPMFHQVESVFHYLRY